MYVFNLVLVANVMYLVHKNGSPGLKDSYGSTPCFIAPNFLYSPGGVVYYKHCATSTIASHYKSLHYNINIPTQ